MDSTNIEFDINSPTFDELFDLLDEQNKFDEDQLRIFDEREKKLLITQPREIKVFSFDDTCVYSYIVRPNGRVISYHMFECNNAYLYAIEPVIKKRPYPNLDHLNHLKSHWIIIRALLQKRRLSPIEYEHLGISEYEAYRLTDLVLTIVRE